MSLDFLRSVFPSGELSGDKKEKEASPFPRMDVLLFLLFHPSTSL